VLNPKAAGWREIAASRFSIFNLPVDIRAANILRWNWVLVLGPPPAVELPHKQSASRFLKIPNRELPIA
jgi:hypothetical protein